MTQELFEFDFHIPVEEESFIVSDANAYAFEAIESWPNWQHPMVYLYGPPSSGKSYLAALWQRKSGAKLLQTDDIYSDKLSLLFNEHKAFIIDNIDKVGDEVSLFHFYNHCIEHGAYLLMVGKQHPKNMSIRLPDLRSRLQAVHAIGLEAPDDALIMQLLVKLFTDRQLKVPGEVVEFLTARIDRTFETIYQLVATIDEQALIQKRNITIPFVKDVLATFDS